MVVYQIGPESAIWEEEAVDTHLFRMSSNAVIDPGKSDDKPWCSDTRHVEADQNSSFIAVGQCDNENRSDDVGY